MGDGLRVPPALPSEVASLAGELRALPGVEAIALGGSRAHGTAHEDSDWDLGVYYRGRFEPDSVRALGYEGVVTEIGEWGGGVFNGGAWLTVGGERVDLLWRDLDVVDREIGEARAGRWRLEPLMFHLTGIPTYLVVAELDGTVTLSGTLPTVAYPDALRERAGHDWADRAELTLDRARGHARRRRTTACLGLLAVGALEFAHAIAATRGRWVTNDKTLLVAAGLQEVDDVVASVGAGPDAERLTAAVDRTLELGRAVLVRARAEEATRRADVAAVGGL